MALRPYNLTDLNSIRGFFYLGIVVAFLALFIQWSWPNEIREVTGTILSVSESKSSSREYNLLVSVGTTVVATKYGGTKLPAQGQEIVLEEEILGSCVDPLLRRRLEPYRGEIKECRKRYTVKSIR